MPRMKRVFIVHGWGGDPGEVWFPWLKSEIEGRGAEVRVLKMPDSGTPVIESWVGSLAEAVGRVDMDTYFIGHSIGCQTIMRYLETLPQGAKVGGVVFVAGFYELTNIDAPNEQLIIKPWLETPIDHESVKARAGRIVAIFSDNDAHVPLTNELMHKSRLGAETVVLKGMNHFNEKADADYKQIPAILTSVLDVMGLS